MFPLDQRHPGNHLLEFRFRHIRARWPYAFNDFAAESFQTDCVCRFHVALVDVSGEAPTRSYTGSLKKFELVRRFTGRRRSQKRIVMLL